MFTYDEVFWLNLTNLVLGLVTLICLLVIGYAVVKEIRGRVRVGAQQIIEDDDHAFVVNGLGLTMADGGRRMKEEETLVVTEDGIESVSKSDQDKH